MPTLEERVGAVETWVDKVHYEDTEKGRVNHAMQQSIGERVAHATKCLVAYVHMVMRHWERVRAHEAQQHKRVRHARWRICAMLVREYKQHKQQLVLEARKKARGELVCAHTRNVNRLAPKGGVVYDETRRNRARIQVGDVYTLRRWPRRDKCGPTLVKVLHHLWGIT